MALTRKRATEVYDMLQSFRSEVFTEQGDAGEAGNTESHDILGELISAIDETCDSLERIGIA